MPELPEVEVVRAGVEHWVSGRTVDDVAVLHPRSVRRHTAGAGDFSLRLKERSFTAVRRRGKYLWLELDSGDAMLAHLGMSGQLLVQPREHAAERHQRVRIGLGPAERELRFVDQRTFGHLLIGPLVEDARGGSAGVPAVIGHIALDPLEPEFDDDVFSASLRRRRTGIKRALLDQSLISGVGNIYADEALWRARLHWARPTAGLRRPQVSDLLKHLRDVLREALSAGGTSFDSLYVNVNGESGYFERGLKAYGRAGRPCERCGAAIRREVFMNRSSYSCPGCQRAPRS
ncbi:bifunctional DNA-formamidopyrimidine glycosylase/DNA-(apurinic or apyrimidinic site) lyase [Streptomonospora wellingtoniae]|uniref:Formamidopyrimidine-DNA glycosylase n=1 Tax=Streptomonospora wellingtoniae TaxID=3075544 RepID=A0ABU2KZH6_9ACTN|nr:bifunctional DNA-formamidopyrimidine glycosylase/DNA-(apurinic or apyrimidinic site) lyase [Streptomonospora sp. DSM 45055]MDT0304680.1 bifunctional DNA-formamidopyrimidine glycosylase/DNA-(apurinic or apyrimidinic site) lyase [Streptomonospora sp. DSM 45055]